MTIKAQFRKKILAFKEKIPARGVCLAPADIFFTRYIEVPANLPSAELTDFLELDLETHSPFPIEQLAWGAFLHPTKSHALLFASPKARLKSRGIENPEKYFQLFPSFIALSFQPLKKATIRFFATAEAISALFFEADIPVPCKVISRKLPDSSTGSLFKVRNQIAESINKNEPFQVEEGLWRIADTEAEPDQSIGFHLDYLLADAPQNRLTNRLTLPESELWLADLRDAAFATKAASTRRNSKLVWKSILAAGAVAILFLIAQIGIGIIVGLNFLAEDKIADQEGKVSRIENKMTLAERISQSTNEDIKPFDLLEAINPLRPNSIYFEEIRSRQYNQLEIQGLSSQGVTPVNSFADALAKKDFIGNVENNSQTQKTQTSFDFVITYSKVPDLPADTFLLPEDKDEEPEADQPEGEG